jgi:hypothetical protein
MVLNFTPGSHSAMIFIYNIYTICVDWNSLQAQTLGSQHNCHAPQPLFNAEAGYIPITVRLFWS